MMLGTEEQEKILLLGDPRLRLACEAVADFGQPRFLENSRRLIRALEQFRAEHGFGRAISAPQIGIPQRMIAMNLGKGPFILINPVLALHGTEKFTLWDDCMSFPWLMVRLERYRNVDLSYRDENGWEQRWLMIEQAMSELLQHEVDHLDGILAVDRALDRDSIIARAVYEAQKSYFDSRVDYSIVPTVG